MNEPTRNDTNRHPSTYNEEYDTVKSGLSTNRHWSNMRFWQINTNKDDPRKAHSNPIDTLDKR